jgi:hypothetical protein
VINVKVLICGDRHWKDYVSIRDTVGKLLSKYGDLTIIEGGCSGADLYAKSAAKEFGIPVKEYPADWEKYGLAAGPIRNKQMLDEENPDLVIAFHANIENSKGTKNMVTQAKQRGIIAIVKRS